jgi:hypothetical protein
MSTPSSANVLKCVYLDDSSSAVLGGLVQEGTTKEPKPGSELERALVDALCRMPFMSDAEDRRIFVTALARTVGNLPDIRDNTRTRIHVIEIVQACMSHPRGLHGLAVTLELFAPQQAATADVADLIRSWPVFDVVTDEERRHVHALLARAEYLNAEAFWYAATDEIAPLPAQPIRTLCAAFDHLAGLNARPDGLPPVLAFVEYVAARLADELAERLRRWNDSQADRLGLAGKLGELRELAAASPVTAPAPPCLVVQLAEHGIDSDLYVLSHWIQHRPGRWHPARGEDQIVTLSNVESVVEELVNQAEAVWGKQPGQVSLEFVLPTMLLNEAVDWWSTNKDSLEPVPLCLDYPVVIRSLERMRAEQYHRFWRNRWQALLSSSSMSIYWALEKNDDIGLWNARLRYNEAISVVVLGEPPMPSRTRGMNRLRMALRAGVPIILWDRREQHDENLKGAIDVLLAGAPLTLARRVKELRSRAVVADAAVRNNHIGRHLTILWDDPDRMVDGTLYTALDTSGQIEKNSGNE